MRVILNGAMPSRGCGCTTLLAHWEAAAHQKAEHCAVALCTAPCRGEAAVVTVREEAGILRYVVPACHWHAHRENFDTDLGEDFPLIPYSPLTTCPQAVI